MITLSGGVGTLSHLGGTTRLSVSVPDQHGADLPDAQISRIEQVLEPGTYHLRVRVAHGQPRTFAILANPAGG